MDAEEIYFEIKNDSDYLKVMPRSFTFPDAKDQWDSKWITTYIEIKAGAFSGSYKSEFMNVDFKKFQEGLEYLYNHLNAAISFESLEGYLKIDLKGDGAGHVEIFCTASDQPGYMGSKFTFYLGIDQTYIPPLIRQLEVINQTFK